MKRINYHEGFPINVSIIPDSKQAAKTNWRLAPFTSLVLLPGPFAVCAKSLSKRNEQAIQRASVVLE
jgi:hypothetical protein